MAEWNEKEFSQKLTEAADDYDEDEAQSLCETLVEHLHSRVAKYPPGEAKNALAILRRKRYFGLMQQVADAFIRSGLEMPLIRRQYAQALLDQSNVTAAMALLRTIIREDSVSPSERAEAHGLMGRAYKQIYMDAKNSTAPKNQEALYNAITYYFNVYVADKKRYLWHGINAVSLIKRAQRDKLDVSFYPDPSKIAKDVIQEIHSRGGRETIKMWDLATMTEAMVALNDWENAIDWLKFYVEHTKADAFELASTLRQFEEVIQLDHRHGKQRILLGLLRAQLLNRKGGELRHSPEMVRWSVGEPSIVTEGFKGLFGKASYETHDWMMKALNRARAVGRIWRNEDGMASGFLVSQGGLLSPKWENQQVFVTNSHVISKRPEDDIRTMKPEEAEITFDALHENDRKQPRYKINKRILWESKELDTTIVALNQEVKEIPDLEPAKKGLLTDDKGKNRIYVIGHPDGKKLSFSLQDNHLLAFDETHLHYRSPTTHGSSGSALFNHEWELVGIHHSGKSRMPRLDKPQKTYRANAGSPIQAIIKAING